MPLEKEKAGDVTLFTLELPEEMPVKISLKPTLFQLGQHVVLTSDTSLAREIIAVHSGQSTGLAGTDEFKRLSTDLKVDGQQLQFVSARAGGYLKLLEQALPEAPVGQSDGGCDVPGIHPGTLEGVKFKERIPAKKNRIRSQSQLDTGVKVDQVAVGLEMNRAM